MARKNVQNKNTIGKRMLVIELKKVYEISGLVFLLTKPLSNPFPRALRIHLQSTSLEKP